MKSIFNYVFLNFLLGKHVVGMSFQGQSQAQSIGYIVPVSVIKHVLDDIELHNEYTAFPIMRFYYQSMENTSYREYLKLNEDQHGILVTSVEQACVLSKVLKEDDVITAIDNVPIADDGTIYFRRGERLNFRYLEKLKFVDDTVTFTIIRQGKKDRKYTFITEWFQIIQFESFL
jgi:S1-C subfamily serine protease